MLCKIYLEKKEAWKIKIFCYRYSSLSKGTYWYIWNVSKHFSSIVSSVEKENLRPCEVVNGDLWGSDACTISGTPFFITAEKKTTFLNIYWMKVF